MAKINPRRVLLPVGVATTLSLLGDASMYTVLPTHLDDAGVLLGQVGILLSANRFIRLVLNGPTGWLADRWSRRNIFVAAMFLGALSTGVYALSEGFWSLLAGRLLWGTAWSGLWVSGNAIVMDVTETTNRGRWVGLYHFSFFLGAASGSIFGGVLTDLLGYHVTMGLASGLTLGGAFAALLFVPETRHLGSTKSETYSAVRGREAPTPPLRSVRRSAQTASAITLFGINRIVVAGVLFATLSLFLAQRLGPTVSVFGREVGVTTVTGLALGISTLSGMVAAPLAGALADRLRNRWSVAAAGLGAVTSGLLLVALGTPMALFAGLPLTSVGSGTNQGMSTVLLGDLTSQDRQGRWMGLLFTVGDLGSAVGPPVAYGLLPEYGLSTVYLLCAGLAACMGLIAGRWALVASRKPATVR